MLIFYFFSMKNNTEDTQRLLFFFFSFSMQLSTGYHNLSRRLSPLFLLGAIKRVQNFQLAFSSYLYHFTYCPLFKDLNQYLAYIFLLNVVVQQPQRFHCIALNEVKIKFV